MPLFDNGVEKLQRENESLRERVVELERERERMAAFHADMGIELEQALRDRETYRKALKTIKLWAQGAGHSDAAETFSEIAQLAAKALGTAQVPDQSHSAAPEATK